MRHTKSDSWKYVGRRGLIWRTKKKFVAPIFDGKAHFRQELLCEKNKLQVHNMLQSK